MLRNTCKAFLSFLLVTQLTDAMDPSLTPINNDQSHTSQEWLSAGPLFDSLGDSQSLPIQHVCSFLNFRDIANLRRSCKALRNVAPYSAGQFDLLGGIQSLPMQNIYSFLDLRDIAHLRTTCRALHNAWNHDLPLWFDMAKLTRIGQTTSLEQNILALAKNIQGRRNDVILYLRYYLTDLPEAISKLTRLKRLDLHDNNFTSKVLTDLYNRVPNLQELDLSFCNLTEVPEAISKLKQLKQLKIWGNNLTPEALTHICTISSLQELDLSNCNLTDLPEDISQLTQLQELNLVGNKLSLEAQNTISGWLPDTKIHF